MTKIQNLFSTLVVKFVFFWQKTIKDNHASSQGVKPQYTKDCLPWRYVPGSAANLAFEPGLSSTLSSDRRGPGKARNIITFRLSCLRTFVLS